MSQEYEQPIEVLLSRIENQPEPSILRNQFIAVLQLYYDGLVDRKPGHEPGKEWIEQRDTLEDICLAYKDFFGNYYFKKSSENMKRATARAKDAVLGHREELLLYKSGSSAKMRHLSFAEDDMKNFSELIRLNASRIPLDTIVAISSGGFEPAFVAMHLYDKASFRAVRYSHNHFSDSKVLLPKNQPADYLKDEITGRNVLLVDDVLATGESFMEVSSYLSEMMPKKLTCAVVYLMGIEDELYYKIKRLRSPQVKELNRESPFESETFFFTMCKNQRRPLHFMTLKR